MMKPFLNYAAIIMATFLLAACEINIDNTEPDEPDSPEVPQPGPNDRNYGFGFPVEEGGNENDDYWVRFQYKDGTVVLKPQDWQWIDHVETDTIVYFKENMPQELRPKVGRCISFELTKDYPASDVSKILPYGLRHKVLELTEADGLLRCVITFATLKEIYEIFEWETIFPVMADTHSIKLTDDLEVPLENSNLSDFGNEEGEQLITEPWIPYSNGDDTYSAYSTRTMDSYDGEIILNNSHIRHYREPLYKKFTLTPEILRKLARYIMGQIADNSGVLNIPEDVENLIAFICMCDGSITYHVGCEFYSEGNMQTGKETYYLKPSIAIENEFEISSDIDISLWNEFFSNKQIKKTINKFHLLRPDIPLLIPIPIPYTPIIINLGLALQADATLNASGTIKAKTELIKLSLPVNLNGMPGMPKFKGPRLKDLEIDGSVGLHFIPALDLSIGINCPPVVHFIPSVDCGVDYNFFSLSAIRNDDDNIPESLNWSYDPKLTFSAKLNFGIEAKLNAPGPSILGVKDYLKVATPNWEIAKFSTDWPLLPTPVIEEGKEGLTVTTMSQAPLTYQSQYTMDPGLIYKIYKKAKNANQTSKNLFHFVNSIFGGEPQIGIQIRSAETNEVIKTLYHEAPMPLNSFEVKNDIKGLENGRKYIAMPVLKFMKWDLPYEKLTCHFPYKKQLSFIGNLLSIDYDEQGRPIRMDDMLEEGYYEFGYNPMTFRYVENDDIYQSTLVDTNEQGFITKITGYYDDGESQTIRCTYSSNGHLTKVENVFSNGGSYTSSYEWDRGLLKRINWIATEEEEEEDVPSRGFTTYTYGEHENRLNQQTIALCEDRNLGLLTFTGLFGLPPTKLPEEASSTWGFDLLTDERHDVTAQFSYDIDADGAIRQETAKVKDISSGKENEVSFAYVYTTDMGSNLPAWKNTISRQRRSSRPTPLR